MTEAGGGPDYTIGAVDRAVAVLEALAEQPGSGVTQIAVRLGLTKSLTFRLLSTLQARGLVLKDPERQTYLLGYRLVYFGDRAEKQNSLLAAAAPILDDLCRAASENVNLVIRDELSSLCVDTREPSHAMRLFAQAGRRGPLHAGGASVVLLAYAPSDVRETVLAGPLERFTPHTVTEPERIREILERIRANRFHVARGDLDDGAFSAAAPIDDGNGTVVAAVSVAGPIIRSDEDRLARHVQLVVDAGREISRRLNPGRTVNRDSVAFTA